MKYLGSHKGKYNDGYIGSGIIFKRAYNKYGSKNFSRKILYIGYEFRRIEELKLKEINAANNPLYYNLKNEALGGSFSGIKNGMYGKHLSKYSKRKISITSKQRYTQKRKNKHSHDIEGEKNPMYNKNYQCHGLLKYAKNNKEKTYEEIFGEEKALKIKQQMSISRRGKKKQLKEIICPHCGLCGKGPNMTRYHFNNCKLKLK